MGKIRVVGIDIGSRTTKLVILENGAVIDFHISDTGHEPMACSKRLLHRYQADKIVATGYGRHLAKEKFAHRAITEIKAYALGAHYLYPECRTVIDVGGQDSKVIRVAENGRFEDFEMNDRCAAGTGRFLEVMAKNLGFRIGEFGSQAMKANNTATISSTCTVFSESEVISLIASGENRRNIALGVHQAIASRLASMTTKFGIKEKVIFCGGVAKNPCIAILLEKGLGTELFIPQEPQIVGALGAALSV